MSLSRQQITLLGIFALFLGPVILVVLMRTSWWQYQPAGMKNHGQLVQPPVHLNLVQTQNTENKWLVLYLLDPPCDKECIEDVTALRQIHRAVGRNNEHLAIALLSKTKTASGLRSRLESIYPEFEFITDSAGTTLKKLDAINVRIKDESGDLATIHTYILDPMLNVILAYGVSAKPNDIHKDLKRLLKWSDQEYTK